MNPIPHSEFTLPLSVYVLAFLPGIGLMAMPFLQRFNRNPYLGPIFSALILLFNALSCDREPLPWVRQAYFLGALALALYALSGSLKHFRRRRRVF